MKKLLLLTTLAVITAGTAGCFRCGNWWRGDFGRGHYPGAGCCDGYNGGFAPGIDEWEPGTGGDEYYPIPPAAVSGGNLQVVPSPQPTPQPEGGAGS